MADGRSVFGSGEDGMASDGGLRDPGEAALEGSMEVLELFPRYLLKGCLPTALLSNLQVMAAAVLADPAPIPMPRRNWQASCRCNGSWVPSSPPPPSSAAR